jgi:hypothetical protein
MRQHRANGAPKDALTNKKELRCFFCIQMAKLSSRPSPAVGAGNTPSAWISGQMPMAWADFGTRGTVRIPGVSPRSSAANAGSTDCSRQLLVCYV